MKFHPEKCKAVSIKNIPSPLEMLPFVVCNYNLAKNMLSYAESEKDLGVTVNTNVTLLTTVIYS